MFAVCMLFAVLDVTAEPERLLSVNLYWYNRCMFKINESDCPCPMRKFKKVLLVFWSCQNIKPIIGLRGCSMLQTFDKCYKQMIGHTTHTHTHAQTHRRTHTQWNSVLIMNIWMLPALTFLRLHKNKWSDLPLYLHKCCVLKINERAFACEWVRGSDFSILMQLYYETPRVFWNLNNRNPFQHMLIFMLHPFDKCWKLN